MRGISVASAATSISGPTGGRPASPPISGSTKAGAMIWMSAAVG